MTCTECGMNVCDHIVKRLSGGANKIGECGELPLPEQSTAGMRLTGSCDGKPQSTSPPLSNEHSPINLSGGAPKVEEIRQLAATMFGIMRRGMLNLSMKTDMPAGRGRPSRNTPKVKAW